MLKTWTYITATILSVIIVCGCSTLQFNPEPIDLVFKNVNIITMTSDEVLENQSVYISNGIIKEIASFDTLLITDETTIIDAAGKFLLPGFNDMHVHTNFPGDLAVYLANGVTTVRNMWGTPWHIDIREDIKSGKLLGPHFYTSGPITDGQYEYWEGSRILTDINEVETYVNGIIEDGYDYIKVYSFLSAEVFTKIMEEANKHNAVVVGHVPFTVKVEDAISLGMQSIEHFRGYDLRKNYSKHIKREVVELTVSSGVWNCPTLIASRDYTELQYKLVYPEEYTLAGNPEWKYVHPDEIKWWTEDVFGFDSKFTDARIFLKILHDAGANIVSGTDVILKGFSLHEEFELMNEAGLTPYEVLLTTTINPARMLGIEDITGTIEVGKNADLVLLDKNPLVDIKNTQTISGVVTQGKWLDREILDAMLKHVEDSYRNM